MAENEDKAGDMLGVLMQEAESFCERMMRGPGRLPLVLFLHGVNGIRPLTGVSMSFVDEGQKTFFVRRARLMCIQDAADTVVLGTQATMPRAGGEGGGEGDPQLSKLLGCREVVVLLGETRETTVEKILPVVRSDNGEFFGFGEAPELRKERDKASPLMFLSQEIPDEVEREMAALRLGGFGGFRGGPE